MFDNIIEFQCTEEYVNSKSEKEVFPTPIKRNIPEWFKKLNHTIDNKTVKGCIPFLDTLTSGYLLKNPQDLRILHGYEDEKDGSIKKNTKTETPVNLGLLAPNNPSLNLQSRYDDRGQMQDYKQVSGWPKIKKQIGGPVCKFTQPWVIKTPPGYSCLFIPILNNNDERFEIIPGIVDTDSFDTPVNFPFIINALDKDLPLEMIIKRGTPIVQVFPFKRESWKMKIKGVNSKKLNFNFSIMASRFLDNYKLSSWRKKSYK